MTTAPQQAPSHTSRVAGYLLALSAGATWGTTGPLSTGLYRLMPATSIGFWRVLIGTVCLALWGLAFRRELRSEEHTSELQSRPHLVCRLLLAKKKNSSTR